MIQVPEFRACALCTHGRQPKTHPDWPQPCTEADRLCVCPEVTGRRHPDELRAVPVHLARARTGPCGPEANHLAFAGLRA